MKKAFVTIGVLLGVGILGYFALQLFKMNTKKYSPETASTYQKDGWDLQVQFCQPSKKGRVIFGELVPFNEVWRTGANEATMFTTNKDITFDGKVLKAGSYSIFTIPKANEWEIIFNAETEQWGTQYNPSENVLKTKAKLETAPEVTEIFTIIFEEAGNIPQLVLLWDQARVVLPLEG